MYHEFTLYTVIYTTSILNKTCNTYSHCDAVLHSSNLELEQLAALWLLIIILRINLFMLCRMHLKEYDVTAVKIALSVKYLDYFNELTFMIVGQVT